MTGICLKTRLSGYRLKKVRFHLKNLFFATTLSKIFNLMHHSAKTGVSPHGGCPGLLRCEPQQFFVDHKLQFKKVKSVIKSVKLELRSIISN